MPPVHEKLLSQLSFAFNLGVRFLTVRKAELSGDDSSHYIEIVWLGDLPERDGHDVVSHLLQCDDAVGIRNRGGEVVVDHFALAFDNEGRNPLSCAKRDIGVAAGFARNEAGFSGERDFAIVREPSETFAAFASGQGKQHGSLNLERRRCASCDESCCLLEGASPSCPLDLPREAKKVRRAGEGRAHPQRGRLAGVISNAPPPEVGRKQALIGAFSQEAFDARRRLEHGKRPAEFVHRHKGLRLRQRLGKLKEREFGRGDARPDWRVGDVAWRNTFRDEMPCDGRGAGPFRRLACDEVDGRADRAFDEDVLEERLPIASPVALGQRGAKHKDLRRNPIRPKRRYVAEDVFHRRTISAEGACLGLRSLVRFIERF